MGREDGIENEAAVVADLVWMGVGQLMNETVGTQESELAADGGGAPAALELGFGRGSVEQLLEVAVADADQGELANG